MDSRKRLAIALAITCLIVAAIFASFGRSLFFVQIPSITLADVDGAGSSSSGGSGIPFTWRKIFINSLPVMVSFSIRKWLSAAAAIWGRWVMQMT